jgi:hypothetical protein
MRQMNIKLEGEATAYPSQHSKSRRSKTTIFGNSSTPGCPLGDVISSDRTLLQARLTASYLEIGGRYTGKVIREELF